MWGQPPPLSAERSAAFSAQAEHALPFLPRRAALAALVPCLHGSALPRSAKNLLLLQFLAARAQGVSDTYVIRETQTPPHRRLRRARNLSLGRKLPRLLREPDVDVDIGCTLYRNNRRGNY